MSQTLASDILIGGCFRLYGCQCVFERLESDEKLTADLKEKYGDNGPVYGRLAKGLGCEYHGEFNPEQEATFRVNPQSPVSAS